MRVSEQLKRLSILVCQLLLAVIVISIFVDVTARYVFHRGFLAAGEFVPYLFTWLAFLGASIAVRDREHLVVDVLLNIIHGRPRRVLEVVIRAAELAFFAMLTYYGWIMTAETMAQRTPYLQLPYGLVYLSVPISGALMCIYTVERMCVEFPVGSRCRAER